MKFFGPHRPERVLLRRNTLYALRLDAKDFAYRSKAKAKPKRREPADASPRIVPIGRRNWIDIEPRKYSFSDYEVSKKVSYLLLIHNMCIEKKMEQFISGKKIFRNISCIALVGLTVGGKHAGQEEEDTRKDFSTVLILQEQLCISELFKNIQNTILLILHYRTMLLFRATSSSTFFMSDVQSTYILSSVLD